MWIYFYENYDYASSNISGHISWKEYILVSMRWVQVWAYRESYNIHKVCKGQN